MLSKLDRAILDDLKLTPDDTLGVYEISASDLELLKRVANTVTPPEGMFSKATPRPARPSTPEFSAWAFNRAMRG
jgi:hypothetical protein